MKISKKGNNTNPKAVKASTTPADGKYVEATEYIRSAISALGAVAEGDDVAKDAIANLSVILFDLQ